MQGAAVLRSSPDPDRWAAQGYSGPAKGPAGARGIWRGRADAAHRARLWGVYPDLLERKSRRRL